MFRRDPRAQRVIDLVFGFGRIITSAVRGASNAVFVELRGAEQGDEDDARNETTDEPFFGQLGFFARPRKAIPPDQATPTRPAGYAEVFGARVHDQFFALVSRDLRLSARVNPKDGEVGIAQYDGGFISLGDASDQLGTQIILYAPKLKSDGTVEAANVISLDPAARSVTIAQQDGTAVVLTEDAAIVRSPSGGSFFELSDDMGKLSAPKAFTYASTWQVYVPNEAGTKAHTILVDDSTGSIQVVHRSGIGFVMTDDGVFVLRSPGGRVLKFSDQGLELDGNLMVKGSGFFGDPTQWLVPTNKVIVGLSGMYGQQCQTLVATMTPPVV
jgi:hypothetical protein